MIFIEETFPDRQSVTIIIDGVLNGEGIPVLNDLCERYVKEEKRVCVHLRRLMHISRDGRQYLRDIRDKVVLLDPSHFLDD